MSQHYNDDITNRVWNEVIKENVAIITLLNMWNVYNAV